MKLRLQIIDAPETTTFEHEGPVVTIGRDPGCELALPSTGNQAVSWKHAKIELKPGGADLSDLGSTNGTFVNDRRIDGKASFKTGDYIRFGHAGPTFKVVEVNLAYSPPKPIPPKMVPPPKEAIAPPRMVLPHKEAITAIVDTCSASPAPAETPIVKKESKHSNSTTRMMLVSMKNHQREVWIAVGIAAVGLFLVIMLNFVSQGERITDVSGETADLSGKTKDLAKQTKDLSKKTADLDDRTSDLGKRIGDVSEKVDKLTAADAANIREKYGDAIYMVSYRKRGDARNRTRLIGTAFAIDSLGVFATNAHVVMPIQKFLRAG